MSRLKFLYLHATDEHVYRDRYLKSPPVLVKSTLQTLTVPPICVVSMLSATLPPIRKRLLTEERTGQSTTTRLCLPKEVGDAPHIAIFALTQTRPPYRDVPPLGERDVRFLKSTFPSQLHPVKPNLRVVQSNMSSVSDQVPELSNEICVVPNQMLSLLYQIEVMSLQTSSYSHIKFSAISYFHYRV